MIPEVATVREIDWESAERERGTEGRDVGERVTESGTARCAEPRKETENTGSERGWRKQRDRDGGGKGGGIGRKQQHRQQQLPLSKRLAVIMRNKLPL